MWSLMGAHGAWDVLAASVRNSVVLWWIIFGDVDALVCGLGTVFGGGKLWCVGDRSKSRVVGAFGIVVVNVVVV